MTEGAASTPLPKETSPSLPEGLAARLGDAELLAVFRLLSAADQENFARWVSAGGGPAEQARKAEILVHALGLSPLAWESRPDLPNGGRPHEPRVGRSMPMNEDV